MSLDFASIKDLLDQKFEKFNNPDFINEDPVQIPHRFVLKEDIEISGFIAAIFSWGNRKTIINKSTEFLALMENAPYDFLINHNENDLRVFEKFKHRTFNGIDALCFIESLSHIYKRRGGLEKVFSDTAQNCNNIEKSLVGFKNHFFELKELPNRTRKHISSPTSGASCKRINMFLRWMVRKDNKGVDFGIWNQIKPSQLICPVDVHVKNIASHLGLIQQSGNEWNKAVNLTENLRKYDADDPVKYDFALFGMGTENYFQFKIDR